MEIELMMSNSTFIVDYEEDKQYLVEIYGTCLSDFAISVVKDNINGKIITDNKICEEIISKIKNREIIHDNGKIIYE